MRGVSQRKTAVFVDDVGSGDGRNSVEEVLKHEQPDLLPGGKWRIPRDGDGCLGHYLRDGYQTAKEDDMSKAFPHLAGHSGSL